MKINEMAFAELRRAWFDREKINGKYIIGVSTFPDGIIEVETIRSGSGELGKVTIRPKRSRINA